MRGGLKTCPIRITTVEQRDTDDHFRGTVTAPGVIVADLWASITPLRGTEVVVGHEKHTGATTRVRVDYYEGLNIDESMQVLHDPFGTFETFETYDIVTVLPDHEGRNDMVLMCRRVRDGRGV